MLVREFKKFHRRPGGVGGLAGVLRGCGGNRIDRRVLDTALRDSRSARVCRESRQCTACKDLRSQVRCSGLPVAATVDELWLAVRRFRPADEICMLRAVSRQRDMLLASQGRHIQHMQKALTQMNVQLANVISDIVGETGKNCTWYIAGERDGHVLAKMKNARIRASEEEIAKSLQGNWRERHLFALKQAMALYDNYGTLLAECDTKLESMLATLVGDDDAILAGVVAHRTPRNAPQFDVRTYLFRLCGVDLTRINGINPATALKVIAEVGPDMSRFKSAKHFASWLGLCPGTKISGVKYSRAHPNAQPIALLSLCG